MKAMSILLVGVLGVVGASAPGVMAATPQARGTQAAPLSLFGVQLKGATRAELRAAFAHSPLKPRRLDNNKIGDVYDASGALNGASTFIVNYTDDPAQVFAAAQYEFPAFMNTTMVQKIEHMVADKYGPPSYRSGDVALGPVDYRWNLPGDMRIEVSRGWPDTTVYLDFIDVSANARLAVEIKADKRARERAKAKAQSTAF